MQFHCSTYIIYMYVVMSVKVFILVEKNTEIKHIVGAQAGQIRPRLFVSVIRDTVALNYNSVNHFNGIWNFLTEFRGFTCYY